LSLQWKTSNLFLNAWDIIMLLENGYLSIFTSTYKQVQLKHRQNKGRKTYCFYFAKSIL
jgi:hypothetical protein